MMNRQDPPPQGFPCIPGCMNGGKGRKPHTNTPGHTTHNHPPFHATPLRATPHPNPLAAALQLVLGLLAGPFGAMVAVALRRSFLLAFLLAASWAYRSCLYQGPRPPPPHRCLPVAPFPPRNFPLLIAAHWLISRPQLRLQVGRVVSGEGMQKGVQKKFIPQMKQLFYAFDGGFCSGAFATV